MKKNRFWLFTLVLVAITAQSGFAGNWQFLFNGKNLDGWKIIGSPEWKVQDGKIVVTGSGNEMGWLVKDGNYSDFVLRARFKWTGGNSGIQIRSGLEEKKMAGYQCNLDPSRPTATGSLVEENKRGLLKAATVKAESYFKANEWNEYEITAIGDHIQIVVNGMQLMDVHDPAGAKDGIIALQMEPKEGASMEWADIRLLPVTNKKDWVSLFDGKSLDGWKTLGGAKWDVKDGAIDGISDNKKEYGWLISNKEYTNFHYSCQFKMAKGNSGIQFRSWVNEQEKIVHGWQADLASDSDWISGHLYDQSEKGILVKPPFDASKIINWNGWNTYEITAIGPTVELFINGVKTIEHTDPSRAKGVFAFQIHMGLDMETFWKDIRLIEF